MITPEFKINVYGAEIDAPVPFENEGVLMLPFRAITETLGFNVEWQGETGTIILTKGPVYVTMSAFEDGYTFSKTAPMMLGTAPILIDGVTFVPAEFINQVLNGAYRTEADGSIKIFDAELKNVALVEASSQGESRVADNLKFAPFWEWKWIYMPQYFKYFDSFEAPYREIIPYDEIPGDFISENILNKIKKGIKIK